MAEHAVNQSIWRRVIRVFASARLRALLSLGMVLGLGAVGTMAAWSTSATATSGEFTTGTIDIRINSSDGPVTYTSAPLVQLFPGSTSSGAFTVTNIGSTKFSYSLAATGTGLGSYLQVTVATGGTVTAPCNGVTTLAPSNVLVPATIPIATAATPLAAQTGSQVLCVRLTLPSNAPNAAQGISGNVSLLFTATSV